MMSSSWFSSCKHSTCGMESVNVSQRARIREYGQLIIKKIHMDYNDVETNF